MEKQVLSFLHKFDSFIGQLSARLSQIAQVGLFLVMLLIVSNIILRRVALPIPGTIELVEILGAIILGCSIAYCLYKRGHIFVNVLVRKLPIRGQAFVDIFTHIAMLATTSLLAWNTFLYAERMYNRGLATGHLGIPIWPINTLVGLGFAIMALVILNELLKAFYTAYKGEE